ncbi:MAG: hypothetical protein M1824_001994 [Vezdaea acicularis]|nr:MAG: hypothetical protein M1824_001994 [Vezdaea acicularis]
MASLPPAELKAQMDDIHNNKSPNLEAFFIICVVLSLLFVALRLVSRKVEKLKFKADDYMIIVGLILAEGSFIVLLIYSFRAGLGKHWITLSAKQISLFAKLNYSYNILNLLTYPFVKISILLFYRRIFPARNRIFSGAIWFGIGFITLMLVSNVLVAIFACHPVRAFWDFTVKGKCINSNNFYWATAVLNVITDTYIILLPMPNVWRLRITTLQKLGLSLLFFLAGLTFATSIIRIVYYKRFNAFDPSFSFIGDAYATPGEECLAIICACLPTLHPISSRMLGTIWKGSSGHRHVSGFEKEETPEDSAADAVV